MVPGSLMTVLVGVALQNRVVSDPADSVDVLIVGAGISGIGAAYHLSTQRPQTSWCIVEAEPSFGGTWFTHTYPGIRSDSDLHTFGYRFKPWRGLPIATADQILQYLHEVIDENDLAPHIHYRRRVEEANWSSSTRRWTVTVRATADDGAETVSEMSCRFLYMCQGYYRHRQGHFPDWPGMADFGGRLVHAEEWPEDLDLTGQRVVVIGSGATAATIVPNIADRCEHVTVLQRSPTYFVAARNADELTDQLRALDIDELWIHEIARRKRLHDQAMITKMSFEQPDLLRQELLNGVQALLPDGFDMSHFTPTYRPWQQRLAFVPDGDLFTAISSGKASMVTDHIETFTEKGIRTVGGEELIADVIIAATGFNLCVLGDIGFAVDGRPVDFADTVTYRGMMFTGVPNLAWVFGYFRASWTLRADLIGDFVCRLLGEMDERGVSSVTPQLRSDEQTLPRLPWVDEDNFNPNYLQRSMHLMPRRLDRPEWQHTQDYWSEKTTFPGIDLGDGCLQFR
jgi:cation diffusion facilitator CzcD-associated flavoprotein CzcO